MIPSKQEIKFACIMAFVTAGIITLTLVSVNIGFTKDFIFFWLRSWLIAFVIAAFAILFIAPIIRKNIK